MEKTTEKLFAVYFNYIHYFKQIEMGVHLGSFLQDIVEQYVCITCIIHLQGCILEFGYNSANEQ